jgi:hypothetical protein
MEEKILLAFASGKVYQDVGVFYLTQSRLILLGEEIGRQLLAKSRVPFDYKEFVKKKFSKNQLILI